MSKLYNRTNFFNSNISEALDYYKNRDNRDYIPALVFSCNNQKWYTNTIKFPYIFISVYDGTDYFRDLDSASEYYTYNHFTLTVLFLHDTQLWYINSKYKSKKFILCDSLECV
jgi:hypothetical protein